MSVRRYYTNFCTSLIFEEQLMGIKYIKNKFGPTPVDFAKIIQQMQEAGDCEEIKSEYYYEQIKILA
ncbi:hypothetical protein [Candidatus Endomicrobiellum trichonymphae]|uniref:hypothetical protein n=1 Tax=Endomicrobium trichonymphae TaxID=1408204 RepID=UPI000BAA715C|nr:hypothetical protein [Candidatus Endomicrobium trichonymphae]